jgi:hypothetical protein
MKECHATHYTYIPSITNVPLTSIPFNINRFKLKKYVTKVPTILSVLSNFFHKSTKHEVVHTTEVISSHHEIELKWTNLWQHVDYNYSLDITFETRT